MTSIPPHRLIAAACAMVLWLPAPLRAAETEQLIDTPFMELIRDRAVHGDLELDTTQIASLRLLTDQFDPQLFPIRNRREDDRRKQVHELVMRVRPRLKSILSPTQLRRLSQIELQCQGPRALLRPDVQARMLLTKPQLDSIAKQVTSTNSATHDAWKQIQEKGRPRSVVQKQIDGIRSAEPRKILRHLNGKQKQQWRSLTGRPAAVSKFGRGLKYKAPEFVAGMTWINSPPVTMQSLRGQVVILHFYAFG
jgi:hypothetical protein